MQERLGQIEVIIERTAQRTEAIAVFARQENGVS